MIEQKCPSCKNRSGIIKIEDIDTQKIIAHYQSTGFDANYLFKDVDVLSLYQCLECGLKYFHPAIMGDSNYYSHLQKEEWYFIRADRYEYEYASTLINKNDNVLDIGCGRGVFSSYINCGFYQGLEFSEKALELAKEDDINVKSQKIEEHCIEKKEFYDVVTMFEVLEHLYDLDEFLKCSLECLKIGGKLVISVPNNDGFIKKAMNNFLNMPPHHVLQWNEHSLSKLCELYPIKISSIKKEKVANIHKEWYWHVKMDNFKRFLSGKKFKSIGACKKSFMGKIIMPIAKPVFSIAKTLDLQKFDTGQGIVVVFEKVEAK